MSGYDSPFTQASAFDCDSTGGRFMFVHLIAGPGLENLCFRTLALAERFSCLL